MEKGKEWLEQIAALIKTSSKKSYEIAETNFRIGGILYHACSTDGESAITKAAALLSQGGIPVSPEFLFDAFRVYRSIKSEATLKEIKKKLHGNLRWGFLVHNCTTAPEGDTEESAVFWEQRLRQIEAALGEADRLYEMLDSLPPAIRDQVEGLILASKGMPVVLSGERELLDGPYQIAHMADMQMDDRFTVAGRIVVDAESGMNERLIDIHNCISFAADRMIAKGCRLCIIAGDATETNSASPNVQRYLLKSVTRIAEHMPVVACIGNHELSKNPKDSTALEFLKRRDNIFVVEEPMVFYQEGKALSLTPSPSWPQKDCAKIFVLPFPSRAIANGGEDAAKSIAELNKMVADKMRLYLHSFRSEIDPRVPNILVPHCTIIGAKGAENPDMLKYDPSLCLEDLDGFDYIAAGHIHTAQRIGGNAYYSGSIDRMDFNEEGEEKGFYLVTFEGRQHHAEFVNTPARTFFTISPEFFENPDWQQQVEARTIYRIKGDVTKEQYEALKPLLKAFPVPLLNKLSVRRDVRIRDEQMTEDLSDADAITRYLTTQVEGVGMEVVEECLRLHEAIISNGKEETGSKDEATLF